MPSSFLPSRRRRARFVRLWSYTSGRLSESFFRSPRTKKNSKRRLLVFAGSANSRRDRETVSRRGGSAGKAKVSRSRGSGKGERPRFWLGSRSRALDARVRGGTRHARRGSEPAARRATASPRRKSQARVSRAPAAAVRSRGDARFGRARGGAEGGERARVARKAPRRPSPRDRALPRTVSRLSARLRRARPRSAPGHRSSAWPRSWQRGAHRGVGRAREGRVDAPSCSCVRCVVDSRRPLDAGAPFTRTSSTARACARAGVPATSGGWRSTASTRLSRKTKCSAEKTPRGRRIVSPCFRAGTRRTLVTTL